MARSPQPNSILEVDGKPASEYSRKYLAKMFAELRLTAPSESVNVKKKNKKKKKKNKKKNKKVPNISNTIYSGPRPAIPRLVFDLVKEAVDIMSRPGWPDDLLLQCFLDTAEYKIDLFSQFCESVLPVGWKYERTNASSLIEGYGNVITHDGMEYMV